MRLYVSAVSTVAAALALPGLFISRCAGFSWDTLVVLAVCPAPEGPDLVLLRGR